MPDTLKDLLTRYLGTGWAPGVQQTGVRPDYGLSTATGINPAARSVYERTLAPGEKRSAESLRDMLAEVILAAGSVAVPVAAPRGQARKSPSERPRPGMEFEHQRDTRPAASFSSLQGQKNHRTDLLYELKRYQVGLRSPDYTSAQKDVFDSKIKMINDELSFTEAEIARIGGGN